MCLDQMVLGVIGVQIILLQTEWEMDRMMMDQMVIGSSRTIIDVRKWQLEPHDYRWALLAI